MNFILDNIFLVAIAAISGIALMLPAFRGSGKRASPTEVTQLINRGKTTILDVRDAAEYAGGHLRDAKHIPLGELSSRIAELDKSKSKTVVVVCHAETINAVLHHILQMPYEGWMSFSIDHTAVTLLDVRMDRPRVRYVNDSSHLGDLSRGHRGTVGGEAPRARPR